MKKILWCIVAVALLLGCREGKVREISIIQFNTGILLLDILMIIGITFVSAIIPLIVLHRIKPINIIKHKN